METRSNKFGHNFLATPENPIREVLKALTGCEPPEFVKGYAINKDDYDTLQSWAAQHVKPNYLLGLSLIEAAEMMVEEAVHNGNIPMWPLPTDYYLSVYRKGYMQTNHYPNGRPSPTFKPVVSLDRAMDLAAEFLNQGDVSQVDVRYTNGSGNDVSYALITDNTGTLQETFALVRNWSGRDTQKFYVVVECPNSRRVQVMAKVDAYTVAQFFKVLDAFETAEMEGFSKGFYFTVTDQMDYMIAEELEGDCFFDGNMECTIKEWKLSALHTQILASLFKISVTEY